MRKILINIMLVGSALLTTIPALAHHSTAMFDLKKVITIEGIVKEFQYTNPHSWLLIDVTDENGKVTTWGFIAEGPSTLMRAGIRKSDLSPGTEVTIKGNPMSDGRPAATWIELTRHKDGKVINPRTGFIIR